SLAGLSLVGQAQEPRYQGRTLAEWQGDLRDLSPQVRLRAIEALRAFGAPAVPALIQVLKDADAGVRQRAAGTLAYMDKAAAKEAVPALIQAVKDTDTSVRRWVVQALYSIGPTKE